MKIIATYTSLFFGACLLTTGLATAEPLPEGLVVEAFGGFPLNLPSAMTVTQQGESNIDFTADWDSQPWQQPIYWAARLRWQREQDGFEIQFMHHKMFLTNPPPTIQHFEVTHGFNILTANYMRRGRPVHWRVGAGVTLPNTFATVRGQTSDIHDYSFSGPALMAGCGSELALSRRFSLAAEAQFIAAWAKVDVAQGNAQVTSLALHLLVGMGYVF